MGLPDGRAGLGRGGRDRDAVRTGVDRDRGPRDGGVASGHSDGERGDRPVAKNIFVAPYLHAGVFIARLKDHDLLLTRNIATGEFVEGPNRIVVNGKNHEKIGYRVWSPFRSKLGAAVLSGVDNIHMAPGSKVLCLGTAGATTVSHVSDIVGPNGLVYAVEICERSSRDLLSEAKKRTNIIPIIADAHHPHKYRMVVGIVDTIYADVSHPDQANMLALNAHHFLKDGGHFVIIIKARCIDTRTIPEKIYANEVRKLKSERLKPTEQVTLEPFQRRHAVIVGNYRPAGKCKNNEEREQKEGMEE